MSEILMKTQNGALNKEQSTLWVNYLILIGNDRMESAKEAKGTLYKLRGLIEQLNIISMGLKHHHILSAYHRKGSLIRNDNSLVVRLYDIELLKEKIEAKSIDVFVKNRIRKNGVQNYALVVEADRWSVPRLARAHLRQVYQSRRQLHI